MLFTGTVTKHIVINGNGGSVKMTTLKPLYIEESRIVNMESHALLEKSCQATQNVMLVQNTVLHDLSTATIALQDE